MQLLKELRYFFIPTLFVILIGLIGVFLTDKLDFNLFWNGYKTPLLDSFFIIATKFAEWPGYLLVGITILIFQPNKNILIIYIGSLLLCAALLFLVKQYVFPDFDRPMYEFSDMLTPTEGVNHRIHYSFPSGHTTSAFVTFAALALALKKPAWQIFSFAVATIVGISRVYLSQHFLMDIIGGAFFGSAIFWVSYHLFSQLSKTKKDLNENLLS